MKQLLYIDLFCGAGGTSTGVELARLKGEKCARVIACVNHDRNAIASHAANHPNALHFTEDIRTLDLTELAAHVRKERETDTHAVVVLWASLECTNFSKAKGGMPRDADSRTLAEHLFRYIDTLHPDYIYIENVEEFMCWGDLDANGKPISRDEGRLYMRWVKNVCKRGFDFDHRLLNSANYGARTSRTRFFGIFARHGLPIVFPSATHCKGGSEPDMFGNGLKPWNAVRDVLELDNEGESIFTRKKPLVEKTLERIYAGLIKFVAGGNNAFLSRYNSVKPKDITTSIDEPCGVVTTKNRFAKVHCQFLSKQFSGHPNSKNVNIDEPSGSITCRDHHALVSAKFIDMQYGNGTPASINAPALTISTNPKLNLVSANPFVMNTNFSNVGSSIDEPSQTITANRKWHYLIKPQLSCQGEDMYIVVYESDNPAMRRIKEFMAIYGIADIKMRMLNIGELKRIMGFGTDYVLVGTQSEQKKYIGNAVEVNMSRVLCEALAKALNK